MNNKEKKTVNPLLLKLDKTVDIMLLVGFLVGAVAYHYGFSGFYIHSQGSSYGSVQPTQYQPQRSYEETREPEASRYPLGPAILTWYKIGGNHGREGIEPLPVVNNVIVTRNDDNAMELTTKYTFGKQVSLTWDRSEERGTWTQGELSGSWFLNPKSANEYNGLMFVANGQSMQLELKMTN